MKNKSANNSSEITKDFLESVIDSIPLPLAVKDSDHRWIIINKEICEIFNMDKSVLLGKTDHDVIKHEEADVFKAMEEDVFVTGIPKRNEEVITEASGRKRWQIAEKTLIKDSSGNKYLLCIGYDITERKEAQEELRKHQENLQDLINEKTEELRRTSRQLQQSQKMEALGQIAGGVAHEYNNIIAIIMGSAEFMLQRMDPGDPDYSRLSRIVNAARRGGALTSSMLSFARRDRLEIKKEKLSDIISEVTDILRSGVPKDIEIKTRIGDPDIEITVDVNQIIQALLNLCINACDSMGARGTLMVETDCVMLSTSFCSAHEGLVPGEYYAIIISDTGKGISEKIRERIFEPFFTTKEKGKGTGLGLSVTLGIIKMHGGALQISNRGEGGVVAKVFLPRTAKREVEKQASHKKVSESTGKTILVVDDEADFLDTVKDFMSANGYRILVADSGEMAIRMIKEDNDEISLMLLDAIMPKMNGRHVFDTIRRIREDINIIVCSGFSEEANIDYMMKNGAAAFLQKSCGMDKMLETVSAVLG